MGECIKDTIFILYVMTSVDSFIWHPQSMPISEDDTGGAVLTLNDISLLTHVDGTTGSTAKEMGLRAELPPREALASSMPHGSCLTAIMRQWADRRHMEVLHSNHAIVDVRQKGIYLMDAIFEKRDGKVCIVLFYYSIQRGGGRQKGMQMYAGRILEICRTQMNFFPEILTVCIHGKYAASLKTHTVRVS